jgi:hypothetical protein
VLAAGGGFVIGWISRPGSEKSDLELKPENGTSIIQPIGTGSSFAIDDNGYFSNLAKSELTFKGNGSVSQMESWTQLMAGLTPERAPKVLAELEPLARQGRIPVGLWTPISKQRQT